MQMEQKKIQHAFRMLDAFQMVDLNSDGTIDAPELQAVRFICHRGFKLVFLRFEMGVFCVGSWALSTGAGSPRVLQVLSALQYNFTQDEVQKMITDADMDGGMIGFLVLVSCGK